jgi:hypothetical protein
VFSYEHPKVVHIEDFENNLKYKCFRRFVLMAEQKDDLNSLYMTCDDDLMFYDGQLENALNFYNIHKPTILSICPGRNLSTNSNEYIMHDIGNYCQIAIGRCMISTLKNFKLAVNFLMSLDTDTNTPIILSGPDKLLEDDIAVSLSLCKFKYNVYAFAQPIIELPSHNAYSQLPNHLTKRNNTVQYLRKLFIKNNLLE